MDPLSNIPAASPSSFANMFTRTGKHTHLNSPEPDVDVGKPITEPSETRSKNGGDETLESEPAIFTPSSSNPLEDEVVNPEADVVAATHLPLNPTLLALSPLSQAFQNVSINALDSSSPITQHLSPFLPPQPASRPHTAASFDMLPPPSLTSDASHQTSYPIYTQAASGDMCALPTTTNPELTGPTFTQPDQPKHGKLRFGQTSSTLYKRFMKEVSEFVALQRDVTKKRIEVQVQRRTLKVYQDNVHQRDTALVEQLSALRDSTNLEVCKRIEHLFKASQEARDKMVPLEDYYETLEVGLGAAEHAVGNKYGALELQFQSLLGFQGSPLDVPRVPTKVSIDSTQTSEGSISFESTEPPNPESNTAQAIGSSHLRCGDLLGDNPQPQIRRSNASTASPNFASRRFSSVSDISDWNLTQPSRESEEQRMVQNLHEMGDVMQGVGDIFTDVDSAVLFDEMKETYLTPPASVSPGDPLDDLSTIPFDGGSRYNSLRVPEDDSKLQATLKGYLIEFGNTRDRINKWLFHILRSSSWEVFQLRRQVQSVSATPGVLDWAKITIQTWDRDDLSYVPSEIHKSTECTEPWKSSDFFAASEKEKDDASVVQQATIYAKSIAENKPTETVYVDTLAGNVQAGFQIQDQTPELRGPSRSVSRPNIEAISSKAYVIIGGQQIYITVMRLTPGEPNSNSGSRSLQAREQ